MTAKARNTWSRSPEMKAERQTERIDRARPLVATRREKVRAIDRKGNKNGARQAAGPRNSRFTSTADIFAAFLDLGGLAMKLAQVVELGTANHAPGDHGYPLYRRRMEREAAFESYCLRQLGRPPERYRPDGSWGCPCGAGFRLRNREFAY